MKTYLRTTHVNGQPKRFSPEAEAAWRDGCNGFVGHMLDDAQPTTADQVLAAIIKYDKDNHEENQLTLADVEAALVALVHHGLAAEMGI